MRCNFFKSIGYNDLQTTSPRTRPESIAETQRFRIRLRKDSFFNPNESRTICKSLEGQELSAQFMDFTNLAKQARKDHVTNFFCDKPSNSFFKLIPVTKQEEIAQQSEKNMSKAEIIAKIEAFFEQAGESVRKKYRGFKQQKKDELLIILEEVRSLFNSGNEFDSGDCTENSGT